MILRRRLALVGIFVIAALLAFPLRETVYQLVVIPLSYLLWVLNILYLSLSQFMWWVVLLAVVVILLCQSLISEFRTARKPFILHREARGSVESLAASLQKAHRGVYFKWSVANRLGKLAYQILLLREHGKPRSVFAPLAGESWDAAPEIQRYLESGLQGSFAEFPNPGYFVKPARTPLDQDVGEVVEFLESKVEPRQI
jgi:hypothetical protein